MDAWINGTVLDGSTSASIAGATIAARVDGTVLPSVVSNATGFYSIQVPSGNVELAANALGYAPTSTSVYVWSAGTVFLNIGLPPLSFGVRGFVRDGVTGAGLPGVLVTVDPIFGSGISASRRRTPPGSSTFLSPRTTTWYSRTPPD